MFETPQINSICQPICAWLWALKSVAHHKHVSFNIRCRVGITLLIMLPLRNKDLTHQLMLFHHLNSPKIFLEQYQSQTGPKSKWLKALHPLLLYALRFSQNCLEKYEDTKNAGEIALSLSRHDSNTQDATNERFSWGMTQESKRRWGEKSRVSRVWLNGGCSIRNAPDVLGQVLHNF